jgi:hypothetical protein
MPISRRKVIPEAKDLRQNTPGHNTHTLTMFHLSGGEVIGVSPEEFKTCKKLHYKQPPYHLVSSSMPRCAPDHWTESLLAAMSGEVSHTGWDQQCMGGGGDNPHRHRPTMHCGGRNNPCCHRQPIKLLSSTPERGEREGPSCSQYFDIFVDRSSTLRKLLTLFIYFFYAW